MKKKFVILCYPRTGSYLLTDLLGRQKSVECHGELLKKNWIELDARLLKKLLLKPEDVESRDRNPMQFLDDVFALSSAKMVGFKMFPFHNQVVMRSLLEDHSVSKIFLGRNPLQSYISLCMANETDKWIRTDRLRTDEEVYVNFDEVIFLDHLQRQRTMYERVLTASVYDKSNPIYFLDYKDLQNENKMQNICSFMGLDKWRSIKKPKFKKQLNRPYEEVVKNWDEVETFCKYWNCNVSESFHSFLSHFVTTLYGGTRVEP
jgi:hypothetical protein